jgi:hypothetical protein
MVEIVNLNRARKARAKQAEAEQATANRAKHGRTKAEREAEALSEAQRKRLLDGARVEKEPPEN